MHLLLSRNYFLVTNKFSDQLLLEDKFFFSTATTSEELFLRKKELDYAEYVLFQRWSSPEHATFSEEELFKGWVFLENSNLFLKCLFV